MYSYEDLQGAYPQGDKVWIDYGGMRSRVEVVGHVHDYGYSDMATPAIQVYIKGYGNVLFHESELRGFGNRPRSKAEQNCFHAEKEVAKRGHELGAWIRNHRHYYSNQCTACGAMVMVESHGFHGTAINSLTCLEMQHIGHRILEELDGMAERILEEVGEV